MKQQLKQRVPLLFVLLFVILLLVTVWPLQGDAEIYDKVIRLHVLANSDSEEDQALKLQVRDAVLSCSTELLSDCRTRQEAISAIKENLDTLELTAASVVNEAGYNYNVKVELGEEEYPTKNYESFCFPSGSYVSLRVLIGDAEGQNWWCVLFPPLCTSAAIDKSSAEDAFISVGLTDEQYKIITETDDTVYEVRFKILETIEQAKNSFKKK